MLMLWGESDSSKISGFIPYTLAPGPAGPLPNFSSLLSPPSPFHLAWAHSAGAPGSCLLHSYLTCALHPALMAQMGAWVCLPPLPWAPGSGAAAPGPLPVAPNRSKWFDLIEPRRMPPDVTLLSLTTLMVAQGKSQLAR